MGYCVTILESAQTSNGRMSRVETGKTPGAGLRFLPCSPPHLFLVGSSTFCSSDVGLKFVFTC